jgi:outer membrane translocation and assembly module TamA
MLLQGEWRWIPSRLAIDMAFFYDTGMVAPRLDAITLGRFVNDYGIGIRFHSIGVTPLRVEYARGDEGSRIVFAGSAAF